MKHQAIEVSRHRGAARPLSRAQKVISRGSVIFSAFWLIPGVAGAVHGAPSAYAKIAVGVAILAVGFAAWLYGRTS